MRIVLDTNVIVSGMFSANGSPRKVLDLVLTRAVTLCLDDRILEEYQEVLLRPGWPFTKAEARRLLAFIVNNSFRPEVSSLNLHLPDPDDLPFIEVALGGEAVAIVTGNTKHFLNQAGISVRVLTPSEFMDLFESDRKS